MGLYISGGLIIGRIFASEIWGAYFHEGLLFIYLFIYFFFGGGGLIIIIIRILWYVHAIRMWAPVPQGSW